MTNKQLQEILKKYPNDMEIVKMPRYTPFDTTLYPLTNEDIVVVGDKTKYLLLNEPLE